MIPPSTSGGITVSWFSIIYPHQVEKHNPDSPFNSLSLSCSPHVIVVPRTNMSYVCERQGCKWATFEVGKFALQVRPVLWVVAALIPGRFLSFYGFFSSRKWHTAFPDFFSLPFNAVKGQPAVPIILLPGHMRLKHVLIRWVMRGLGGIGEKNASNKFVHDLLKTGRQ